MRKKMKNRVHWRFPRRGSISIEKTAISFLPFPVGERDAGVGALSIDMLPLRGTANAPLNGAVAAWWEIGCAELRFARNDGARRQAPKGRHSLAQGKTLCDKPCTTNPARQTLRGKRRGKPVDNLWTKKTLTLNKKTLTLNKKTLTLNQNKKHF
jgi:hypothetical protein